MNEIDFINTNHPLNLEQEFGNGYIESVDCFLDEDTRDYYIGLNNAIIHFFLMVTLMRMPGIMKVLNSFWR